MVGDGALLHRDFAAAEGGDPTFLGTPLPKDSQVLGKQLLRSGTSVAAHDREARTGEIAGALQELDETDLWPDLLPQSNVLKSTRVEPLRAATTELIAILVTMTKKVKARR